MFLPSRRLFLGASLAALASGRAFAADKPAAAVPKARDDFPFQPSTLFLTWQRDPTTTMTVQWVGARSLHRLQGAERFHLALDEHGRVMDVSRSGQRKAGAHRVGG